MQIIISYAKNALNIKEIIGRYAKINTDSENVMKKLGFTYCRDINTKQTKVKIIMKESDADSF